MTSKILRGSCGEDLFSFLEINISSAASGDLFVTVASIMAENNI